MIRKIVTTSSTVSDTVLRYLHQLRLLADYADVVKQGNCYTQIVNIKCDDKKMNDLLKKKFNNSVKIIK